MRRATEVRLREPPPVRIPSRDAGAEATRSAYPPAMAAPFTLLDAHQPHEIPVASRDGEGVWLDGSALQQALGWQLKPEGLCQGDVCIPVRDRSFVDGDAIELQGFAEALGRPLALDAETRTAALGTPAASRAASLTTLEAPDFTLPDLTGREHSLSAYRGKKVLLIAYSSW